MDADKAKAKRAYFVTSIIMIAIFILIDLLSYTVYRNAGNTKYLLRMISRGLIGLLILYHSSFLLLSKKPSFLSKGSTAKQRKFSGILLGIVGIIMILTAFLGYGTNGDPRFIWWE